MRQISDSEMRMLISKLPSAIEAMEAGGRTHPPTADAARMLRNLLTRLRRSNPDLCMPYRKKQ